MRHFILTTTASLILTPLLASQSVAQSSITTEAGPMRITPLVQGLDEPWGVDHLPDGTILITERAGRLIAARDGSTTEVAGLPDDIVVDGQGGLLDILIPADFSETRDVYLTYSKQLRGGAGTAVYHAKLSEDGTALTDGHTIFQMDRGSGTSHHFGSRLVEGPEDTLFITVGDRGNGDLAQDVNRHNGKVLRIHRDGSVPQDNPFAGQGLPEVWSYGHRNPQGAAMDASGQLWTVEHGAKGGDEVNRITPGTNYGWPVISYGTNYNGSKIGQGTEAEGMAQPVFYWDPSIAPSGMTFYDGPVADWQGCAFIGSLKFNYISRLCGDPLAEVERIEAEETGRVRDVTMGPDGSLRFLSVIEGALYSLSPEG
ncbi:PQQ-dependent sugar dehydrogenase [Sagittula sp. S175]|uniref:PQQ-dependent sugar dehydrogenase n=1 Tax=Sagittula sp. S175 TaxID=3415129 RepID=UPI003C7B39B8